jgi:hypothetical protein
VFPRWFDLNVQFPRCFPQSGKADTAIDHSIALRAETDEIAAGGGERLVIRHAKGWLLRGPASYAIDFTRFARFLILRTPTNEERGKIGT